MLYRDEEIRLDLDELNLRALGATAEVSAQILGLDIAWDTSLRGLVCVEPPHEMTMIMM